MKKIYRIYKDTYYNKYEVQEFRPQRTFMWFFLLEKQHWQTHESYRDESEAMTALRRVQKYGDVNVIYQDNIDELDLGKALE